MSFLIDPPWLYANGYATAKLPERAQGPVAAGTVATFLVTSVSLYLNLRWVDWLARLCRAENGRDWMLNSGVLDIDHRRAGRGTHAASAALFLTYPLWLWLGLRRGRRRGPVVVFGPGGGWGRGGSWGGGGGGFSGGGGSFGGGGASGRW